MRLCLRGHPCPDEGSSCPQCAAPFPTPPAARARIRVKPVLVGAATPLAAIALAGAAFAAVESHHRGQTTAPARVVPAGPAGAARLQPVPAREGAGATPVAAVLRPAPASPASAPRAEGPAGAGPASAAGSYPDRSRPAGLARAAVVVPPLEAVGPAASAVLPRIAASLPTGMPGTAVSLPTVLAVPAPAPVKPPVTVPTVPATAPTSPVTSPATSPTTEAIAPSSTSTPPTTSGTSGDGTAYPSGTQSSDQQAAPGTQTAGGYLPAGPSGT